MMLKSKAVIVWIDDYFSSDEFKNDSSKNNWNKLFGNLGSKVYRLLDIKTKFISTANEALDYISKANIKDGDTYFYFIVDRNLPYVLNGAEGDTASEDIILELMELKRTSTTNSLDFSMLSSSSSDTYSIKGFDFYNKPRNQEFQLPNELRHKILINIKNHIGLIQLNNLPENISIFSNETSLQDKQFVDLFPFVGKYRSFVELQEIESKDTDTFIVLTKPSISDNFLLQSLWITLYDIKKNYGDLSYLKYVTYDELINDNALVRIQELDTIPIIRLKNWSETSFDGINSHLKYQLKVLIMDENDDNINYYLSKLKKFKVLKVDGVDTSEVQTAKEITYTYLIGKLFSNKKTLIETHLYKKYPQLLLHPVIYRMLTDYTIISDDLDDPSEILNELNEYFNQLNLEKEQELSMNNDCPIIYPIEYIYDRAKKLYKDQYTDFMVNTIKFWLSNSWNINYNILIADESKKMKWQRQSFDIMLELFENIDLEQISCKKSREQFYEIKEGINSFDDNSFKLVTKVEWPHEKYPMPTYMLNQLHKNSGKKLYLQDKDLKYVEDSVELENSFRNLEYKIGYYRDIFTLIENTAMYLPSEISEFVIEITELIKKNEPINNKEKEEIYREKFKKLANIILRIAIQFGILIREDIKQENLNYKLNAQQPFSEDKAGLGKLVSDVRDHIYAGGIDIFQYNESSIRCSSYLDSSEHQTFMYDCNKILSKTDNLRETLLNYTEQKKVSELFNISMDKNLDVVDNIVIIAQDYDYADQKFKRDDEVKERVVSKINKKLTEQNKKRSDAEKHPLIEYRFKNLESAYLNKIYIDNNITYISQLSNLSSFLSEKEHELKIQKHKHAYVLLSYLADTRNTWEHGDLSAWNRELFIEAFIYSYESIWLMQKYILETVYSEKNLPKTKYISLNNFETITKAVEDFQLNFKTKEIYDMYFSKLYTMDMK